jgi:hypothetical protein
LQRTSRSTSLLDRNREMPNFGNSRFGNSSFGHSSALHGRNGSSVRHFGGSRFGGARQFESAGTSFNSESSFGGDEFSFIPDLFGLALNLGGFGLRGLGLLGSGLGEFGLQGLRFLDFSSDGSAQDAGLESRQWGPGPILYPDGTCACPQ